MPEVSRQFLDVVVDRSVFFDGAVLQKGKSHLVPSYTAAGEETGESNNRRFVLQIIIESPPKL